MGAQVALCTTLVMAAMLLSRAIPHALSIDPGFALMETAVATVRPPAGYGTERMDAFRRDLLDALRDSPLWPVGMTELLPLRASALVMSVRRPSDPVRETRTFALRPMTREAFEVLRIPLVAGRYASSDAAASEIVVNRAFARAFGRDPIGQVLIDRQRQYLVVGIVADAHLDTLDAIEPTLHTTRMLSPPNVLFSLRNPDAVALVQTIARRLEPRATVVTQPLREVASASLVQARTGALAAWAMSALGLLISGIGLCGVFGTIVEERRREIGVRIALGARGAQVVRTLMSVMALATGGGLVVGLVASAAVGQALRGFLYGLSPLDPTAYAGVAVVLGACGAAATFFPSRRATRIDPAITLRGE
jgi:hypothetical protein